MKITKVCCQGCGADLEVDESVRYVTCNYCDARLEIVHDKTVTHSRLLEKIERQTEVMADDLKVIRLQNDLDKLDREWSMKSQSLMVTDKNGSKSVPSSVGSIAGGIIAIVGGVIWMGFASSMGSPGIFPLFGLVIIGFGLVGMFHGAGKAQTYQKSKATMEREREKLLRQINEAKRSGGDA